MCYMGYISHVTDVSHVTGLATYRPQSNVE